MRSARLILAPAAALALLLSGCNSTTPASETTTQAATQAAITFEEMWVKATDEKMTAAFGFLHNTTDKDIHVTGVSSDVAGKSELHETVDKDGKMMMQEMKDGFVIKAGDKKELKPGGDHLMLMMLKEPIAPGQDVTVKITTEGGEEFFFTAPARTFAGAQEEYGVHGEDDDH